jgi:hypothetical protein
VERNSFEGLKEIIEPEPVDPLTPPAVDLVARYRQSPAIVESVFDGATELEEATPIALRKLVQILDTDFDPDDLNRMRAQISAATTILNLQVKVDEGRLKRRKVDILPKLLEMMAVEEGRLSQRMIATATVIDAELG